MFKVSWTRYQKNLTSNNLRRQKSVEKSQQHPEIKELNENKHEEISMTNESLENSKIEAINTDESSTLYRTPEFVWADVHIKLLSDLLYSIENVLEEWSE